MSVRIPLSSRHGAATLALVLAAACGRDSSPAAPTPAPTSPVVYAAIGASDALGVGASAPCLPLVACPNGTGYVPVIARRLSETRQVTTTNLGIPGAVIGPEIQQLGQRYGRFIPGNFIEHELPNLPRDATVVTVFAGGNDVNAIGAAAEGGAAGADLRGFLDTQVQQFRASHDALIAGIRQRAPAARIVVANLPNLAALPYASEYSLLRQQGMQRLSVAFSTEVIDRLAGEGVPVVDLLCDGRVYDAGRYSSDGFHPNDAGYSLMAELLLEGILRGLPAPATSCGPMQVVPSL